MRHLGAAGAFCAFALFICSTVLPDPTHRAIGHPGNDVWNHVWGYWWVKESLLSGHLPLHTALLSWPDGGSLWFIDNLNAVLSLPVQLPFGPVAAYNASIAFNLILCGAGAYSLAFRVTRNWHASLVAGIAYMTTPHLLSQIYNGVSEALSAGWVPLAVLFARETAILPTPKRAIAAGVFLGFAAVANWYYGLFALGVALALLTRAAFRWLRLPAWRRKTPDTLRTTAKILALAGASAGLVLAGPTLSFRASLRASDALVSRGAEFVWMSQIMHNMTDVVTLVHPGKFYSPDLRALQGEDLLVVSYLGLTLVFVALFLMRSRAVLQARPWFWLFLGFTTLALGPYLYFAGEYVTLDGGWIGLPFLALRQWAPIFASISHANRFVMGSGLALSVLVAIAVASSPRPRLTALVLGTVCATESLAFSPAVWPVPYADFHVPAATERLTGGAVLDLPISVPVLARSRYLAGQLVHHQAVPYGLNDPFPRFLKTNHFTATLISLERWTIDELPPELPYLDLAAAEQELRGLGLRWVVVHKADFRADQLSRVSRFLDLTLRPTHDDDELRIYELEEPVIEASL